MITTSAFTLLVDYQSFQTCEFSVLFFIKKAKLLKNGEAPVCMRITVNGCMVDISIKRSCPVNLWNQAKENSKGKDRMSVELNHNLEITRSHVHQIYRELETSGKVITVDLVRKLFYGSGFIPLNSLANEVFADQLTTLFVMLSEYLQ